MAIFDHSRIMKNAVRGMAKAQRMNEFRQGITETAIEGGNEGTSSGWRRDDKLMRNLKSRITLSITTIERNLARDERRNVRYERKELLTQTP